MFYFWLNTKYVAGFKEILESSPNRICWGRSGNCIVSGFVFQVISEHCLAKILLAVWETFLYENIVTMIPAISVTNWGLFFFFCPFVESKNKNQVFSKLAVW